jgi:Tfp pilus assembly protein PilO
MKKQFQFWLEAVQMKWLVTAIVIYFAITGSSLQVLILPESQRYDEAVLRQNQLAETYIDLVSLDIEMAIENLNTQLAVLDSLEAIFKSRLLGSTRVNAIFPVLDRFCTNALLKVVTLEPMNKFNNIGKDYQAHLIRLSMIGRFQDFLKFLDMIEKHSEWILIDEMGIKPLERNDYARYDLTLSVLVSKEGKKSEK